ncbi:hypothetical protein BaRGS_00028804 [Batillaria attramentaria]|uniref:Uncharacterized protein n=1 Tax=Batillaria attramentaria TaxID=370345 RepID=A0ABD0JY28_9CAEN
MHGRFQLALHCEAIFLKVRTAGFPRQLLACFTDIAKSSLPGHDIHGSFKPAVHCHVLQARISGFPWQLQTCCTLSRSPGQDFRISMAASNLLYTVTFARPGFQDFHGSFKLAVHRHVLQARISRSPYQSNLSLFLSLRPPKSLQADCFCVKLEIRNDDRDKNYTSLIFAVCESF